MTSLRLTLLLFTGSFLLWALAGLSVLGAQVPELVLEKLPRPLNTPEYDEVSPVVSRDGQRLYFTRTAAPDFNRSLLIDGREAADSLNHEEYNALLGRIYRMLGDHGASTREPWRSVFNQDIYRVDLAEDGSLDTVVHCGPPLNNALPNSIGTAMPEPGRYLVINEFPREGGMAKGVSQTYYSGRGRWSWPTPVVIDSFRNTSDRVGMTVSEDGEVMILSIKGPDSRGDTDLYVSHRLDSVRWSRPRHLGSGINTPFRESTPSLSDDKRVLYFSSNRRVRSGNDIYFCRRLDSTWTNWSRVRRFREPINSDSDDSQPYFNEPTGYLYFTSTRDGSSDVYRVRVQEPRTERIKITGAVINARTGHRMDARVSLVPTGGDDEAVYLDTKRGRFTYFVDNLNDLYVSATREGFVGHVERLTIRRNDGRRAYNVTILLDSLEKGGRITLDPIYFEQGRDVVRSESLPQLEKLRNVLRKYPDIFIRIEGHTDNQGPVRALDVLSRRRAAAIKDYLEQHGISAVRLQATGFGARRPIADNTTLEGRRVNRRVDVRITRIKPRRRPAK